MVQAEETGHFERTDRFEVEGALGEFGGEEEDSGDCGVNENCERGGEQGDGADVENRLEDSGDDFALASEIRLFEEVAFPKEFGNSSEGEGELEGEVVCGKDEESEESDGAVEAWVGATRLPESSVRRLVDFDAGEDGGEGSEDGNANESRAVDEG